MNSSFKIVEGIPSHVEIDVNNLLKDGWKLNGALFHRNVDGNNVAVQSMSKNTTTVHEQEEVYVFRLQTTKNFDTSGIPNIVHATKIDSIMRTIMPFVYRYNIKLRAESKKHAQELITDEVNLQILARQGERVCQIDFLNIEKRYI